MVVPGNGEGATEDHNHIFSFFNRGLKANHLCYLTAKKTTEVSQTYIFTFFFVCEVFSKEGKGNYFYMRHLFYLKPL